MLGSRFAVAGDIVVLRQSKGIVLPDDDVRRRE